MQRPYPVAGNVTWLLSTAIEITGRIVGRVCERILSTLPWTLQ